MLARFVKIQPQLSALVELLPMLPTHLEIDSITKALRTLKEFNDITVMLQRDGITFVEERRIFDVVLLDYPEFEHDLSDSAMIVDNQEFEKAVMKISKGMPLTDEQRTAAACLLSDANRTTGATEADRLTTNDEEDERSAVENYAQKVEKRLKRQKMETDTVDNYINLDVLPGTSVNCERLFSLAKHILTDTRKTTSSLLFEALIFLKVNRSLWDMYDVGRAMGRTAERADVDDDNDCDTTGSSSAEEKDV